MICAGMQARGEGSAKTISTTVTARFSAPGEAPAAALARWRANRPAWLPDRYRETDRSPNSITWEARHTPFSMKLKLAGRFGAGQTSHRITARFHDDGAGGSRITVSGSCDAHTYRAITAAAQETVEGGVV